MADFVLIHGGAHGPWCWEKVIPFLGRSCHARHVVACDLLADAQAVSNKPKDAITIADYVDGVVQRIRREKLSDIILVGHSMAGITIPAAVRRVPDRIRRVMYLTTSNPPVGRSIADLMEHPLSPVSRGLGFDAMFCSDLDEETTHWLKSHLREDPPLPFQEKVKVCTLPSGVPSTYIVCEKDRALPVEYQLEQARNAQVDEIVRIDAGHSAFASKPQELTTLLLKYSLDSGRMLDRTEPQGEEPIL